MMSSEIIKDKYVNFFLKTNIGLTTKLARNWYVITLLFVCLFILSKTTSAQTNKREVIIVPAGQNAATDSTKNLGNKNSIPNLPPAPQILSSSQASSVVQSDRFYLYMNNQSSGPFTPQEIREKLSSGEITQQTNINKIGTSDWAPVSSYFSPEPPQADYSDSYYILLNAKATGPFKSEDIESKVASGEIVGSTQINKVGTSNWVPVETVFPKPTTSDFSDSYYVNINGQPTGPFNSGEIKRKLIQGEITKHTKINKVGSPNWIPVRAVFPAQPIHPAPSTVAQQNSDRYYVLIDGVPAGPYSVQEIKLKLASGEYNSSILFNKTGTPNWIPAKELFAAPETGVDGMGTDFEQMNSNFYQKRASSVLAGNVMYGVGTAGSWIGSIVLIKGISDWDESLIIAGFGTSVGFGLLRLPGVIVSGVAATRLKKRRGSSFSWGLAIGGGVTGLVGNITTQAMFRNEASEGAIIGTSIAFGILQDVFWILHCVKARAATKRFRPSQTSKSNNFALAPFISPTTNTYGLQLSKQF